jgi:hypothetical protein
MKAIFILLLLYVTYITYVNIAEYVSLNKWERENK